MQTAISLDGLRRMLYLKLCFRYVSFRNIPEGGYHEDSFVHFWTHTKKSSPSASWRN